MTPEEILADLRDIHLPALEAGAGSTDLVLWPVFPVIAAALFVTCLVWRRRSMWRRDFFHDLCQIEHAVGTGGEREGWARLAVLLKRLAIQRQGRQSVARLHGEPWLRQLDDLIGGDLFTNGPGRGLLTFPYRRADSVGEAKSQGSEMLKATIKTLRRRLQPFRLMG